MKFQNIHIGGRWQAYQNIPKNISKWDIICQQLALNNLQDQSSYVSPNDIGNI